ncbi:MAG: translocation/assembly module TamB [Treponema sp.]|nr:translocation/assembly module TamB [Treponema sp.]
MSFDIRKDGKIIISRSFYIKILILLILIGFSSLAFKPVHNALSGAITSIRGNFIEKLEAFTGMEIRYSSIRPVFFNSFDIRNLRFIKNDTEVLTVSRARFYFSLRDLFSGKKLTIHTIQIDRPALRMDLIKDKDIIEHLKSLSGSSKNNDAFKQITSFMPDKANYKIRHLNVLISKDGTTVQLGNMNMNFKMNEKNINLEANSAAEISLAGFFDRTIIINADIGINGKYFTDGQEIKANISLSSLVCSERNQKKTPDSFFRLASAGTSDTRLLFKVNPVNMDFTFKDKIASLAASGENQPLGYFFRYDTETKGILSQISFNNFFASSFINFSNYWKNVSYFLNTAISGNVLFKYENNGKLDYSVYLKSGNPARSWQENPNNLNSFLTDAFLVNIYGDKDYVVVNDFCLNASADTAKNGLFKGIINFKGGIGVSPLKPSGTLSLDHLSFTGEQSVNGVFSITSRGRDIEITSKKILIGSFSIKNFNTYLNISDKEIGAAVSAVCEDNGAVYLDAVMNKNPGRVEASLSLNSFSVYNLAEAFRPFTGFVNIPENLSPLRNISIDTDIFLSTDYKNIAYNVPKITVSSGKTVVGEVSLSGTNQHFLLNNGVFYMGKNELTFSAEAAFPSEKVLDFSVNANYLDVSWNIAGHILDKNTLIISDPNGLHVYGSISNTGALSGYIEGVNFPVPTSVSPVYMNFYGALRYYSADFWSFDVSHFKFQGLYTKNGEVNLNVSGIADQDGASFKNISYNDNKGSLAGGADFKWEHDFSYLQFFVNVTDGKEKGEAYKLEGMLKDNHLSVNGSVSAMRVDRFIQGKGIMLASADGQLSWNTINSFNTHINLSSFSARQQAQNIQASGDLLFSNNNLVLRDFKLDYNNIKIAFPVFNISPADGIAKINTKISGFNKKKTIEGVMDIDAGFNKIDSWINIGDITNSFKGTININNIKYGDLSRENIAFLITGNESAISISGGINDMIRLKTDNAGNFYLSLSDPFPVRGSFSGVFDKGNFDAYTSDFYIDMASLWKLAGDSDDNFNLAGGYITGKMNLRGPVWNPQFYGSGTGTSFNIQVPGYVSENIRPVPFHITAEGYEMSFGPVVTSVGGGGGNVSGWLRFEYWVPKNVGLNVSIPKKTPVPYSINIAGFTANGDASGKLAFVMNSNDKVLEIKGDLFMDKTEMGVNMEQITSLKNASFEDDAYEKFNTVVDINITTGPTVEFFWPNKLSPILRVNPEMGTVFSIKSDSQAGQYSLVSDINIRRGEINYMDRNFHIRQGNIIFRESETQFNPRLSVKAEIRERSDSGPVTIYMIIDNEPLLSFAPRFESTPTLTQLEINAILGHNLASAQGGYGINQSQRLLFSSSTELMSHIVSSSDIMTQMIFMRRFERSLRNFLNLDMLSIRTKFIQNAVITGTSGFPGNSNRIGNYLDNTTVFIGKYMGNDMFAQGTLTLKYDENSQSFGGIKFEPDIGIELQSPFFSIRWSFFPNHPENWWVNDHSITLTWRKSF